jgi:HTH-type transcriptional regulator/antitoxin HigA
MKAHLAVMSCYENELAIKLDTELNRNRHPEQLKLTVKLKFDFSFHTTNLLYLKPVQIKGGKMNSTFDYDRALALAEEIALHKLLVTLIEAYEAENYPMDESAPHEILQHIMEASGTRQADLVNVIGSSGVVSEVVNGKRSISKAQAKALGNYFNVSPSLFI